MSGPAPFGFRREDGRLVPHRDEAPVRREMFELFLQHERVKTVARLLNETGHRTRRGARFSDTSVLRLLQDASAVDGIVSKETWDRCQTLLTERTENGKSPGRTPAHPLGDRVECRCGGRMYLRGKKLKGRFVCKVCRAKVSSETLERVFRQSFRTADGPHRADAHRVYRAWPSLGADAKRQLVERLVACLRVGSDEIEVNLAVNPGYFAEIDPNLGNTLPSEPGFRREGKRATRPGNKMALADPLPFLLSVDEAAELLRTTRKAVYAMVERGALPGVVRVGRRLLVRRHDLLRWLDESRAPSPK